ncbi:MAG: putative protein YcgM [Saprospiraceae bacterium]|nr:putative protein YcgM [Saprospiraceae bacterium]
MTFFCIGRNYSEHIRELSNPVEEDPVVFLKPAPAMLHDNRPFYYPSFTEEVHHELELIFKFGRKGKSIPEEKAWSFLSQVSVGIDFTARDLQRRCKERSLPWEISKAFDQSAVCGRWIPIESVQRNALQFELYVNNRLVQSGRIEDMLFPVPKVIHYLSQFFLVNKGDILFTGTPAGVGPVHTGDQLRGHLNGECLFEFSIR